MTTALEKLCRANRWRVREGKYASTEAAGFNGWFLVPLDGEIWQVCIADGMGFRHLSVTNHQKKMLPPWKILCRLKDAFFADDETVVLYIPAKDDYIDLHPFVHHLWSPIDQELPKPLIALV
jgi:hypothetical protein